MISYEYPVRQGENIIYGTLYRPEGEGKYPAVLLSHGYNGIGKDFEKECTYYADHGFVAYALDFCGGSVYSKSTGKSTDMTVFTEKENLKAVFFAISELPFVDSENVFLFGGSQGGFVSTLTAEELLDRVRALAVYYPAYCIPDNWRVTYPTLESIPDETPFWGLTLGRKFFEEIHSFDPYQAFGNYKGNVLIVHGDNDPVVPLSYSERMKEIYPTMQLVVLPNEAHGYTESGAKTAMQHVLRFLQANVK